MTREKKQKIITDKLKDKIIRDIWTLFETKEEKEARKKKKHIEIIIKDRIIRDIRTLFKQEEDYYEPKRVSNFWINNYIEYEGHGDKSRNLSLGESLTKPYLRDILIDLQNSDAWEIQLTIAINFISSKDGEEEHVMHSSSGNIKFAPYSDANDVIYEIFKSVRSKHQVNLETSRRGSDFLIQFN